jgi:hypothetical protein
VAASQRCEAATLARPRGTASERRPEEHGVRNERSAAAGKRAARVSEANTNLTGNVPGWVGGTYKVAVDLHLLTTPDPVQ